MLRKILRYTIITVIVGLLVDLYVPVKYNPFKTVTENLPRESFVRITKVVTVNVCETKKRKNKKINVCIEGSYGVTASGFSVGQAGNGTYIMSADHVCSTTAENVKRYQVSELDKIFKQPKIEIAKTEIVAIDIRGKEHPMKVVGTQSDGDLCLLYAEDVKIKAIPIAQTTPRIGEKVYNIAAPVGYSFPNMIPILEGYYSGLKPDGFQIFTIPAMGGSSGSPVVNDNYEVVGMIIQMVNEFNDISISPMRVAIKKFIKKTIKEHKAALSSSCKCSQLKEEKNE